MVIVVVTVSVMVLLAIALFIVIRARRVQHMRAATLVRRRCIEREQRLAELRMQRALQDTVQALFKATRVQR